MNLEKAIATIAIWGAVVCVSKFAPTAAVVAIIAAVIATGLVW